MSDIVKKEDETTQKQRRQNQRRRDAKKDGNIQQPQEKNFRLLKNQTITPKKIIPADKVETFKNRFSLD